MTQRPKTPRWFFRLRPSPLCVCECVCVSASCPNLAPWNLFIRFFPPLICPQFFLPALQTLSCFAARGSECRGRRGITMAPSNDYKHSFWLPGDLYMTTFSFFFPAKISHRGLDQSYPQMSSTQNIVWLYAGAGKTEAHNIRALFVYERRMSCVRKGRRGKDGG